jgi:hypothetical protein
MTTTSTHPLVADYFRRLERAARVLPRHQRDELLAEIGDHLDAGITTDATEAEVRNLLDDLGSPEAIVAAARPDGPSVERGPREVAALIMLVTGLPIFFFGWVIGVALLLWSPLWTARQKLLGILVFPGGYILTLTYSLLVGARTRSEDCVEVTPADPLLPQSGGFVECASNSVTWTDTILPGLVIIVVVVAPLLMAAHLYRAAGRRAAIA